MNCRSRRSGGCANEHGGETAFGTLDGNTIDRFDGDMFDRPTPTGDVVALADVTLLPPTQPTKMVGLWNNFAALGAKLNLSVPPEPLYFIKGSNAFIAGGETIRKPPFYDGRVLFEASSESSSGSAAPASTRPKRTTSSSATRA